MRYDFSKNSPNIVRWGGEKEEANANNSSKVLRLLNKLISFPKLILINLTAV